MRQDIRIMYRRVRHNGGAGIVGQDATGSLRIARTIVQFDALESAGLVRIECRPDDSPDLSYIDTWEHMSERELKERLWDQGIVGAIGQYRVDEHSGWQTADSIWGCAGYENPPSPFENCYVPDIMRQTIDALTHALRGRFCQHCGHRTHVA